MDLFVRRRAQTLRMIVSEEKLELLRYSELYVELGILEGRLRVTIPTSLTRKEGVHHPNDWISFITLDERFRNKLKQARIQQRKAGFAASNSIADFLPMSFWSRVISKRHFTSLWIPYVHKISCDFEARQSFKYFQIFEQRLHNATVDRNFVAHFNFSRIDSLSDSLENVRWLQRAMGLVKAQ